MGKTSSTNFGIYRDRDSRRRHHQERHRSTAATTGSSKILLVLSCTAGILLVVSLLVLSVTVGKERRPTDFKRRGFRDFSVRDQGGIVTVSKENTSWSNLDSHQEESRFIPTESESIDLKTITRTSRAMNSHSEIDNSNEVQMYRTRVMSGGRSTRFFLPTWSPTTATHEETGGFGGSDTADDVNHQHVAVPNVPQYSDQYAQLETYKHPGGRPHQSIKNIIDYVVADPSGSHHQVPGVKIMGVYVKAPMEVGEMSNLYNGHAYTPDPFKYYKPAHPSEINHLATSPSEQDKVYRFATKSVKPVRFPSHTAINSNTGLTEAIFHPYDDSKPIQSPASSPPSLLSSHQDKKRPLKILLDIYPIQQTESSEHVYSTKKKRPSSNAPVDPQPSQIPGGGRMIVHLNLFPKKQKKKIPTTTPLSPTSSESILTLVPGRGYSYLRDFHDRKFVYSAIIRKNNASLPQPTENAKFTQATTSLTWTTTTAASILTSESGSIHGHPSPDSISTDTEPTNLLSTAINDDLGGIIPRNAVEDYDDVDTGEWVESGMSNSTTDGPPLIIDDGSLQIDTSTYVDDSLRRDLFNLQATASSVVDFEQEYLSSYETSVDKPI